MRASEGLQEDRYRCDSDEKAEPAKAPPVRAVPPVPGHPEIREGEQQRQRRRPDRGTVGTWAEGQVHGHEKGHEADEDVDDGNLAISDPPEEPYPVEAQHSADPEES